MAKGTDRIEQQAAATAARREEWSKNKTPTLTKNMLPTTVRFLEQGSELHDYAVHPYEEPNPKNPGRPFNKRFTCLNDSDSGIPCPGCEMGMDRKFRGVYNVIHRQRGILQKDKDGRPMRDGAGNYIVIGYEDAVVILNQGSVVANTLKAKDASYGGLMSGELRVTPTADSFAPMAFEPADITNWNVPLSQADLQLAAQKHNLDEYMRSPSYDDAMKIARQWAARSGQGPSPVNPGAAVQPPQSGPAAQGGTPNVFV